MNGNGNDTLDKNRLIERIKKLLALAENNNHEGEMESARRKAAQLMADYSIAMSEILTSKPDEAKFVRIDVEGSESVKVNWESSLAYGIAHCFDCSTVNTNYKYDWKIAFMGCKSDLEIAIHFFKFLRRTVAMTSEKAFNGVRDQGSYAYGMVVKLIERLEALYKLRNELSSECTALAIVKNAGVEKFVNKLFPRLHTSKVSTLSNPNAYFSGQKAGEKVSLHRPISNKSTPSQMIA